MHFTSSDVAMVSECDERRGTEVPCGRPLTLPTASYATFAIEDDIDPLFMHNTWRQTDFPYTPKRLESEGGKGKDYG